MDIQKGDTLIHRNGSWSTADGTPADIGTDFRPHWIVPAWLGNKGIRMPIQLSAIVEVQRGGEVLLEQLELFEVGRGDFDD